MQPLGGDSKQFTQYHVPPEVNRPSVNSIHEKMDLTSHASYSVPIGHLAENSIPQPREQSVKVLRAGADTNQELPENPSLREPARISLEMLEKAKKSNKGKSFSERSSKSSSYDTQILNDGDYLRVSQADIHKQSTSFVASTPNHDLKALALPLNSACSSNNFITPHSSNQPTTINISDVHRHLTAHDSSNSHASSPLSHVSPHPVSTAALPASLSASNALSLGIASSKKPVSVTIDVNKANKLYKTGFLTEKSTSSDVNSQFDYYEAKSMKSNQTQQFSDSPPSDYSEMDIKPTIGRPKARIDVHLKADQSPPCSPKVLENDRPFLAEATYDAQDTHLQHAALNLPSSQNQHQESGFSRESPESHHNSMSKHPKSDISADNAYNMQGIYLEAISFPLTNFLRI